MASACPLPQPEDGMIRGLLGSVDCNVRAMSEAGYGALAQANSPMAALLTGLLTLYICVMGYRLMIGRTPLRVGDLTIGAIKIGAVLALATNWPTYQQLVFDTLFRGPEQFAGGMLDAVQPSGSLLRGDVFAGLQAAYDELQASAAYFTQRSLSTASPLQGGNAGAALALNASALLLLLTGLGAVLAAKIVLGLLLGLGPLFVAMLLFDVTRGLFEGWLRASVGFALVPLLAILGVVVQLTLIEPDLTRLAGMRSQGVVELGPPNSIFLLTLICTGVSLALAIAVAIIATSLRLPAFGRSGSSQDAAASEPRRAEVVSPQSAAWRQMQVEPRAAAIAAAATALERRESRMAQVETAGERRMGARTGRADDVLRSTKGAPIGQAYRRGAQPRRTASNLRRDR
jgi:type IV secretion system protein VirB6